MTAAGAARLDGVLKQVVSQPLQVAVTHERVLCQVTGEGTEGMVSQSTHGGVCVCVSVFVCVCLRVCVRVCTCVSVSEKDSMLILNVLLAFLTELRMNEAVFACVSVMCVWVFVVCMCVCVFV